MRAVTWTEGPVEQATIFGVLCEYNLVPTGTDANLAVLEQFYRSGWLEVLNWEGQFVGSVEILPVTEGVLELDLMKTNT